MARRSDARPSTARPGRARAAHGHDRPDAAAWAERFEAPERVLWQKPAEVVGALSVARGATVADLGAGTGYFTLALARAVGPRGRVYAVDTEPALLAHLARRAAAERAPGILPVTAAPDDPRLPSPVDLAFACNAYHHFAARERWAARLVEGLAPGGRVAIVDWRKRRLPLGPPSDAKLAARTVIEELGRAGLRLVERHAFLPYQYFLVLAR